jgi:hypothetical protein
MAQADSKTSVISIPTRRRFMRTAGATALAGAVLISEVRPPIVAAVPIADPIYNVIEAHRKAVLEHNEAERVQFALDAGGKTGERREEYERLVALDNVAWGALTEAGWTLVNTLPTTLAGILALCRYIEPLFGETDQPDLPEYIDYENDAQAYIPEAFAYVIGRAIEELMKAPAGKAVLS